MTVKTTPLVNVESIDSEVIRDIFRGVLGGAPGSFAGGIGATNGGAHGVCGATHLAVSQSGTPGPSVDVAAGVAIITGTASALQGPYGFVNDAAVTLAIAPGDATNPRKDLVIAQTRDGTYDGTGIRQNRLTVVTGTPAASPADPSLAAFPGALVLARVDVPALDTSITNSQITDLRTFAGRQETVAQIAAATTGSLVRRRDTRADVSYATGATDLSPDTNVEAVGSVLKSAATYTVPSAGTYALSVILNPTTTWGSTNTLDGTIVRGGVTVFQNARTLRDTSIAVIESWTVHLNANDTVKFTFTNNSGSAKTVAIEVQIAKVTPA